MMSAYDPPNSNAPSLSTFVRQYWGSSKSGSTLTTGTADLRYLKLSGSTVATLNGYNPTTEYSKLANQALANADETTLTGSLAVSSKALAVPVFTNATQNTSGTFTVSAVLYLAPSTMLIRPWVAIRQLTGGLGIRRIYTQVGHTTVQSVRLGTWASTGNCTQPLVSLCSL